MKKKVNRKKEVIEETNEMGQLRKLAYIFCILLGIFLIFYGIAYMKTDKESKTETPISEVIQYEEVLVSNIGKQSDDEYFALVYKKADNYKNIYSKYISVYSKLSDALNVYYSDLNNDFNKQYNSDKASLTDINNLKFTDDVLFRIKKGTITKTYVGVDAITEQLRILSKVEN